MTSVSLLGSTSLAEDPTVAFIVLAIFAALGYRISVRHQILRGRTPWGFPSIVWALIGFLFPVIGLLIELVAERTTPPLPGRPDLRRAPGYSSFRLGANPRALDAVDSFSLANGDTPVQGEIVVHAPAFGWYPDTTGRHELRYWDGKRWSDYVSDRGTRSEDPLEAPPAAPAPHDGPATV